jgi:hypothetical protein
MRLVRTILHGSALGMKTAGHDAWSLPACTTTAGMAGPSWRSTCKAAHDRYGGSARGKALFVADLLGNHPALATTMEQAKTLREALRREPDASFGKVLSAGTNTVLAYFAISLRRDAGAIGAALVLP